MPGDSSETEFGVFVRFSEPGEYGWIDREGRKDPRRVLFQATEDTRRALSPGARVQFRWDDGKRQAVDVRLAVAEDAAVPARRAGQTPAGEPANHAQIRTQEPGVLVGHVIRFDRDEGEGFISPEAGGRHVFFRRTEIVDSRPLRPGDKVEFTSRRGSDGRLEAANIRCLSSPAEMRRDETGVVDAFNEEHGTGRIIPDEGASDVFVRDTAIADGKTEGTSGQRTLHRGDRVQYVLIPKPGAKLPEAANVRVIPRVDADQPRVFVLGGVKELILREVRLALAPLVLKKLEALEKADPSFDWWKRAVLPYLTREERERYRPRNRGEAWFKERLEDTGFLLRYLATEGPRDEDDIPQRALGPRAWSLLGFRDKNDEPLNFPAEITTLRDFRNHTSHSSQDEWTRETDDAIAAAAALFNRLRLPDREEAVKAMSRTRALVKGTLEHLAPGFLARPDAGVLRARTYDRVEQLREAYEEKEIYVLPEGAQRVTVEGVFAPRLLLDRFRVTQGNAGGAGRSRWRTDLQAWLFRGMGEWAPSWDLRTSIWAGPGPRPLVGQLVDPGADEGESICVVLPPGYYADKAEEALHKRGSDRLKCFRARLTGRLRYQREIPELDRLRGAVFAAGDFCVVVDEFQDIGDAESYTGYLWKCLAPKAWTQDRTALHLSDVVFVWEHTELAKAETVKWSLDSLNRKCDYFASAPGYGGAFTVVDWSDPIVRGDAPLEGRWRLSDLRHDASAAAGARA